ncbi:MAG: LmeA family phospholipid-binding protein [Solirubrobacteraceae bacterium]
MRRIAAIAALVAVLVLLVVAQLVLPGIAEQQLRDRLSSAGQVQQVSVSAFPAIELLWHQADRVVIRMGRYRSSTGHLSGLLDQSAEVGSLDATATELDAGLLTLHDATLRKRGDQLSGSALIEQSDLRRSIPILQSVAPVASGNGRLVLRGTATLFGVTASVDAIVGASGGRLLAQPDVPFGALATITIFSDPRIEVQGVGASPARAGFTVSAQARLR